jgi:hypothetical protein
VKQKTFMEKDRPSAPPKGPPFYEPYIKYSTMNPESLMTQSRHVSSERNSSVIRG